MAQAQAAPGETMAAVMQLAIALLTAGLDSPELEAWAADTLTPVDADGLGDFMVGLHVSPTNTSTRRYAREPAASWSRTPSRAT